MPKNLFDFFLAPASKMYRTPEVSARIDFTKQGQIDRTILGAIDHGSAGRIGTSRIRGHTSQL